MPHIEFQGPVTIDSSFQNRLRDAIAGNPHTAPYLGTVRIRPGWSAWLELESQRKVIVAVVQSKHTDFLDHIKPVLIEAGLCDKVIRLHIYEPPPQQPAQNPGPENTPGDGHVIS